MKAAWIFLTIGNYLRCSNQLSHCEQYSQEIQALVRSKDWTVNAVQGAHYLK